MINKLSIVAVLLLLQMFASAQESIFGRLYEMFDEKDYFTFLNKYQNAGTELSKQENMFLYALAKSILNKPAESISAADSLLTYYSTSLQDSMKFDMHSIIVQNSINLFEYKKGLASNQIILKDYRHLLDSNELDEYTNSLEILKAAADLGVQKIEIKGDSKIKITRDIAGLANIPVVINGTEEDFIFDTGANISTIRKSLAEDLKLVFLKGKIKVGTATGKKVNSELAYAESLVIGNMKFSNVLFLVLPDEALSFAGGLYKIDGIIGFPVFKEMKEVHIMKDELFVPLIAGNKAYNNLLMDGFTPVVSAVVNGDTLTLTFDTGAKSTLLYNKYYTSHKEKIDGIYELQEFEIGGAGGTLKVKGFKVSGYNFSIAGAQVILDNIRVIAQEIEDRESKTHGNLGQDYFGAFGRMVLNFENMYVEFVK